MSGWLAYQLDVPASSMEIESRLERVERLLRRVFTFDLVRRGECLPRIGTVTWDQAVPDCRWPSWSRDGDIEVTTAYAPIGWQRLTGDIAPERAPAPLARILLENPAAVSDLAPPFALAILERDTERLTILNDGLGFARIYTMAFPGGRVWSNRLAALPVFAGKPPAIDQEAWRYMSGAGWFMGTSTPIAECSQLLPSTLVLCRPHEGWNRTVQQTGAIGRWVAPRFGIDPDIGAVADEMIRMAQSVSQLWRRPPVVHLSGGRDSRTVAAAVVASGIEAIFHTVASLKGELDVALKLLEGVGRDYQHRVVEERDVTASGDLRSRTVAMHLAYDGIYGPAGVKQSQLAGLAGRAEATLSGAGGEIARGNFYLGRFLDVVSKDREAALARLDRLYRFHGGVYEEVHRAVTAAIDACFVRGEREGVTGPALLDYFYLDERLRRWSNASTRLGSVAPLVTPAFIRAAFDSTPAEKVEGLVPMETIARLVPSWRDVPFYKAGKDDHRSMTRPRIWQTSDREVIENVLKSPHLWDDVFDPVAVSKIWAEVEDGAGLAKHEMLIQRLVWRAFYGDHLDAIRLAATLE